MTDEGIDLYPMERAVLQALTASGERGLSSKELAEIVDAGNSVDAAPMNPYTIHQHISRLRHKHHRSIEMVPRYRLGQYSKQPHPLVLAARLKVAMEPRNG